MAYILKNRDHPQASINLLSASDAKIPAISITQTTEEISVPNMNIQIDFSPVRITRVFIAIVAILSIGQLLAFALNTIAFDSEMLSEGQESFYRLFDFDGEANFPAFYSSVALLFSGVLLGAIVVIKRQTTKQYIWHWIILALGFVYLAIDEAAKLHEMAIKPVSEIMDFEQSQGVWVVMALPIVILVGLFFARFLFHLPSRTRWLFIIAGGIYVLSSIGLEIVATRLFEMVYGLDDSRYLIITFFEELFEMLGIVLFIYALLSYLQSNAVNLSLEFTPKEKTETAIRD